MTQGVVYILRCSNGEYYVGIVNKMVWRKDQ